MPLFHRSFILSLVMVLCTISVTSAQSLETMLSEAREKVHSQDYQGALLVYEAVIERNPDTIEALTGKARVLSWMGNYVESRIAYDKALLFSPDNIEALTGKADTYAWDKDYPKAIHVLEPAIKKHPDNREVLIRYARYHLWSGKYKDAGRYAEFILKQNPLDEDAIKIKEQTDEFNTFEYFAGYSYLDINNADNGNNIYAGIRYYEERKFEVYGQVDRVDRFNTSDVRGLIGGSVSLFPELTLSAEVGVTPDAEIYPNYGGWIESAFPVSSSIVLYCNVKYSDYDDVTLRGIAFAAEFYPGWNMSLFGRVTFSESEFATGGDSDDTSYMLKATYFINSTDEIYGYYASGNESFKIETIDSIGNIEADIYGIGGTVFLTKHFGMSPEIEYQDRARGTRYMNFRLELVYRK